MRTKKELNTLTSVFAISKNTLDDLVNELDDAEDRCAEARELIQDLAAADSNVAIARDQLATIESYREDFEVYYDTFEDFEDDLDSYRAQLATAIDEYEAIVEKLESNDHCALTIFDYSLGADLADQDYLLEVIENEDIRCMLEDKDLDVDTLDDDEYIYSLDVDRLFEDALDYLNDHTNSRSCECYYHDADCYSSVASDCERTSLEFCELEHFEGCVHVNFTQELSSLKSIYALAD